MDNSSTTPNSEPSPAGESSDVGQSPFREGAPLRPTTAKIPAVGHSTRVADIIMLTVVVAVLLAIAAERVGSDTPLDRDRQRVMAGLIVVGSLAGLGCTLFVQRKPIAALYGGAVGAGLGAALPSLLLDESATLTIAIGAGVMLASGAILGTLRRHSAGAQQR